MSTESNRGASPPTEGLETVSFAVPEMDCPSCAKKITTSVQQLAGIEAIEPEVTTGTVHVEYDPSKADTERIVDRIEVAGYAVEKRRSERTDTFDVPDMDCPSCAGKIENALDQREGVLSYDTQPTTGTVVVTYDCDTVTQTDLVSSIEGAGLDDGVAISMPTPQDSEAAPVAGIEINKVKEQLLSEIGSVDSAHVQKRVIGAFLR